MGIKRRIEVLEESMGLQENTRYWITGKKEKGRMDWAISRMAKSSDFKLQAIGEEEHREVVQRLKDYLDIRYRLDWKKWERVFCGAWSGKKIVIPLYVSGLSFVGYYN